MKNIKIADFLLYGLVLLVLAVFIFRGSPKVESSTFILKTIPLVSLLPHEHNHGDSIMTSSHHTLSYSMPVILTEDLWVKGVSYSIKNARETVLHHAELAILNEPDIICPNREGKHIFSVGEDQLYMPEADFPEGYAHFIPRGSEIFFYTMFHNPKPPLGYGETHYNVTSELKLDLASKEEIPGLKPMEFIRLGLTDKPCGDNEDSYVFKVPAKVSEFVFGSSDGSNPASKYVFPESGKIIYMGGHTHGWEGGKYLSVYLNGKQIKKYETKKSPDNPYTYNTPHGEENIQVKKGDVISITATYDNNEPEPLNGAMGMLVIYFAKD
ncbi:MAG: hypothetical protein WAW92_00230 [Minisyncoccia bacterium]